MVGRWESFKLFAMKAHSATPNLSFLFNPKSCAAVCATVLLASISSQAQVSTINSAWIDGRVFHDIPGATFTPVNNYPSSVSLSESGVSTTNNVFANRDVWYYSNNGGSSAYGFGQGDFFTASFNITLTGNNPNNRDVEAGFIFSNPSGVFGGDCQVIVSLGGVVAQFGGPSYYPFSPAAGGYPGQGGSTSNYPAGATYAMKFIYTIDPNTSKPAFEYSVNGAQAMGSPGNPYFDLGGPVGNAGDWLGGYLQVQNDPNNPNQSGQAVFSNISITPILNVPEPAGMLLLGLAFVPLARSLRPRNR
ncbi:MAG: hypothetical protein C5B50_25355 [Verrucomicrobia bacterium]|nr:MAG: hypothetical protein C5B50_25355 [Verrucomicrobiota bacterium]